MKKEMLSHFRGNVLVGSKVDIALDRNREKIVSGVVKEILTKASHHPHGMKVKLEDGNIGRVKKIRGISISSVKEKIDINDLIKKGEKFNIEYKSSGLWSLNFSNEQIKESKSTDLHDFKKKASKVIIAKTIAAFLNTQGGYLIIGIKENKNGKADKIIGVNDEFKKIKDPTQDGYSRMIIDDILRPYFPSKIYNHLNDYIDISFPIINDKVLCLINVTRSDTKIFLDLKGKRRFFIRTGPETRIIEGEELVEYCEKRF